MSLDYEKFILRQTEWRGEVTNKLDTINSDVNQIKSDMKELNKKLEKLNNKITDTNIKMAGLAATVSLVVTITTALIINGIG